MYGNYWRIDVKALLKESRNFGKEKLDLERQKNALLSVPSSSKDICVQSSNKSDITSEIALKREHIDKKIKWIETHQKALQAARCELTDKENEIIDMFFFTKNKQMNYLIDEFSRKYKVKKSWIYGTNTRALEKIQKRLEELLQ